MGLDWKKLRPMIVSRIENRAKEYPVKPIVPVAQQVLKARSVLYRGISLLLQHIPISTCRCCSEVYVGENGHLIRTCGGYRRGVKNRPHKWIKGSLKDILIPVETFQLQNKTQKVVTHNERFDYDRISAIVELCQQAGAEPSNSSMLSSYSDLDIVAAASLSELELRVIARETLEAWEMFRSGVQRLLFVYPAKVCKYCSEVHVGISGHKARLCGVFKFESWRGTHLWEKAKVDDLVPPKIVWFRRPQDPPLLLDEGRSMYGHAPAVVDLCSKAGAIVPPKYHCMMKLNGSTYKA
ncbi:hypothetical protein Leryth_023210 [Lithospermum erythrorhizon]|nr:hypothetical protein Leryth_023210 [Lithospermum erythrorhizon]